MVIVVHIVPSKFRESSHMNLIKNNTSRIHLIFKRLESYIAVLKVTNSIRAQLHD